MKFIVRSCWGGNTNFYFRVAPVRSDRSSELNLDGWWTHIDDSAGKWTRTQAREVLDELYRATKGKLRRCNIRFIHV
jgi:hypothetical protein